jgi:hypothetical protein
MTTVILVSIALVGCVRLYRRARSSKRWKAALDAYAEREIARDRSFPRPRAGFPLMTIRSQAASELAIDET